MRTRAPLLLLLACAAGLARADYPVFCDSSCTVSVTGSVVQRVYMHVPPGQTYMLTVNGLSAGVPVQVYAPTEYATADVEISDTDAGPLPLEPWTTPRFNPYYQTAEYPTESQPTYTASGPTAFFEVRTNAAFSTAGNLLFEVGSVYQVTATEVVAMPIPQYNTHGAFWTQQPYFWIFLLVAFVLGTIYVIFARCRFWQMLLVYSMSSFVTVFSESLYNAILAATQAGSGGQVTFGILCVSVLANLVPVVFAMLFMRFGKCRPLPWSVLGVMVGAGFLFLAGAGWFGGPGFLILASLARIAQSTGLTMQIR